MSYVVPHKAHSICCPLCSSRDISIAIESVIADSCFCANCRAYFSVTAVFPPPTYILTNTTWPKEETP